ncbi:amidase [Methylococcus sp. EFPC2]|uniref:amidase n=1 Tax=Methylococcus sp. EFPC2 TaxID=2812648 RepID=UPI0019688135|nr:amidase [Methylococcus sp. EFPC2]QSA98260.1 amidase [Methylococcus sp. EFPC2]
MSDDLTQHSAAELVALYRRKAASPVEVTKAVLARIEALQPRFNAYRVVNAEGALIEAKASETRWRRGEPLGSLDGVPVAFKDLLHVKGFPTRKGSVATQERPQAEDSPAAARLRESGAVILGKTQTAEFGWKGLTETELGGVTRNAWDSDYASGGSSGGAAVSAALGLGPLQIGTDGGGSIRQPASVNGVFGFKPSYGRVPGFPPAHNGNLFHLGPLTRTVTDAALALNVISAPDVRDWTALPYDNRDWTADLEGGIKGLRIAYSKNLGYLQVDPGIAAIVAKAVARLADLGAIVEEADPGISDPSPILEALAAERAIRLRKEIGDAGLALIDPKIRESVERAERHTLADVVEANERRWALAVQLRRFHQKYDLLVTPVTSQPVPRVGTAPAAPFLSPFNLTQQPAASVPASVDLNGLPVGLHIVGPPHADALVLRAARAFEIAQPFHAPHIDSLRASVPV